MIGDLALFLCYSPISFGARSRVCVIAHRTPNAAAHTTPTVLVIVPHIFGCRSAGTYDDSFQKGDLTNSSI